MASNFDRVIQEFHEKRFDKDLYAQRMRHERMQELKELAEHADQEMRKRRAHRYQAY